MSMAASSISEPCPKGAMTMLELYHHGSSVCAAKVRLYLGEKGLDWTGHYIDILRGDQFTPEYMKLNPKAVVPTLVHDGKVICDSSRIRNAVITVWGTIAHWKSDCIAVVCIALLRIASENGPFDRGGLVFYYAVAQNKAGDRKRSCRCWGPSGRCCWRPICRFCWGPSSTCRRNPNTSVTGKCCGSRTSLCRKVAGGS